MKKFVIVCFIMSLYQTIQAQTETKNKALQSILDKTVDNKNVFGTSFAIQKDTFKWSGTAGNLTANESYFIASTTKLFTTALIMQLKTEGLLKLDDPIKNYLNSSIINGLHIYKGIDHSSEITIKHLLSHTSGLPDYFQDKGTNGKSLEHELVTGNDQYWSFEQAIERTKKMGALFIPGSKGKAHYSDANFQLLGKIIEQITQQSYAQNCQVRIIQKLGMNSTYLYVDPLDKTPKTLYYTNKELHIPQAMTSFGPDGGMVSNSADMLLFIRAFFEGKLFPKTEIEDLQKWNKIFFPFQSGVGIHLFKLPKIVNPTGKIPYFIGHSGLSGALAYYSPKENLFIVGTVNQIDKPELSFKTMVKLCQVVLKREKK